jgi:hypothetical protein
VALLSVTVEGVAGRLGATTELLDAAPALGEG